MVAVVNTDERGLCSICGHEVAVERADTPEAAGPAGVR